MTTYASKQSFGICGTYSRSLTLALILALGGFAGAAYGGLVFQNFEARSGLINVWNGTAGFAMPHTGRYGLKLQGTATMNGIGIRCQTGSGSVDFLQSNNDRLTFWVYAQPSNLQANTVLVRLFDNGLYRYPGNPVTGTKGFEVWTTAKTATDQWTKLSILFDQLPRDFDLRHVNRIEFANYWPGTYYIDDLQVVREDRAYQSFEPAIRGLSTTDVGQFGWIWPGTYSDPALDFFRFTQAGEPVFADSYSWALGFSGYWQGTDVQSQQEYLYPRTKAGTQSFRHVDLHPAINDRLSFWVYALPDNGLDNNIKVQFFDQDYYRRHDDGREYKIEYWTTPAARFGKWTRILVPLSDLSVLRDEHDGSNPSAPPLNLGNIDRIQFQTYWPGTYYLDQIQAIGSVPQWDRTSIGTGILKWSSTPTLGRYRLEKYAGAHPGGPEVDTPDADWALVSAGSGKSYTSPVVSQAWYRVRAEEPGGTANAAPFTSAWSDVLEYHAPAAVIHKATLVSKTRLEWSKVPRATAYEVQRATTAAGPWLPFYKGAYRASPLTADKNTWYRVRAISGQDSGDWSPAQSSQEVFLRAVGKTIQKGSGGTVLLRGVNLGNYLLVEQWMGGLGARDTGLSDLCADGDCDQSCTADDWHIRALLKTRFGATRRDALLRIYEDSFLKDDDFDRLMRMGVTLVRLPVSYQNLLDDTGSPIPGGFDKIDWVVNAAADRGIYVLIDMHGAPGSQSKQCNTGRKRFNRLFADSTEGEGYRKQLTTLWGLLAARYRNASAVMGYDLLNEPTGVMRPAPDDACGLVPTEAEKQDLWRLYGRLYTAIRAVDPNHIIVMEGIWGWDTLPKPSVVGWQNVAYSFHYYYPHNDVPNDFSACARTCLNCYNGAQQEFMDQNVADAQRYQDDEQYQVPVVIGEFNPFVSLDTWQYYLDSFNEQGWHWALWSYKVSDPNSTWGLMTDYSYDPKSLPRFATDSYQVLAQKLARFDTLSRYVPNDALVKVLGAAMK